MEKRKFEFDRYAEMHDEKEVTGKDGTKVTVRNHIPCAEKEQMAIEMAEVLMMTHDDSCMFESHEYVKIEQYMIAKYYTDIDTDGVNPDDISNFFVNNDLFDDIKSVMWADYSYVERTFDKLVDAVKKTYDDDRSIRRALRTSFGFLFTGEDIAESMAHAEGIKDTLFEAIGALRKLESEREEKINDGRVMVGGNMISFAKKE